MKSYRLWASIFVALCLIVAYLLFGVRRDAESGEETPMEEVAQ